MGTDGRARLLLRHAFAFAFEQETVAVPRPALVTSALRGAPPLFAITIGMHTQQSGTGLLDQPAYVFDRNGAERSGCTVKPLAGHSIEPGTVNRDLAVLACAKASP